MWNMLFFKNAITMGWLSNYENRIVKIKSFIVLFGKIYKNWVKLAKINLEIIAISLKNWKCAYWHSKQKSGITIIV